MSKKKITKKKPTKILEDNPSEDKKYKLNKDPKNTDLFEEMILNKETPIPTEAVEKMKALAMEDVSQAAKVIGKIGKAPAQKPEPTQIPIRKAPAKKIRKNKGLRRMKTLNPQQQKLNQQLNQIKSLEKRRKEYFEEVITLKARNKDLLKQREKLIVDAKINEDKAWMYDHMVKLNLDMHTFFSAGMSVLDGHSDIISIKEKSIE